MLKECFYKMKGGYNNRLQYMFKPDFDMSKKTQFRRRHLIFWYRFFAVAAETLTKQARYLFTNSTKNGDCCRCYSVK